MSRLKIRASRARFGLKVKEIMSPYKGVINQILKANNNLKKKELQKKMSEDLQAILESIPGIKVGSVSIDMYCTGDQMMFKPKTWYSYFVLKELMGLEKRPENLNYTSVRINKPKEEKETGEIVAEAITDNHLSSADRVQ